MIKDTTRVYDPTFLNTVPEALTASGAFTRAYGILSNEACGKVRIEGGAFNEVPEQFRTIDNRMDATEIAGRFLRTYIALAAPRLHRIEVSTLAMHAQADDVAKLGDYLRDGDAKEAEIAVRNVVTRSMVSAYAPR